jgi:hypothetical protein
VAEVDGTGRRERREADGLGEDVRRIVLALAGVEIPQTLVEALDHEENAADDVSDFLSVDNWNADCSRHSRGHANSQSMWILRRHRHRCHPWDTGKCFRRYRAGRAGQQVGPAVREEEEVGWVEREVVAGSEDEGRSHRSRSRMNNQSMGTPARRHHRYCPWDIDKYSGIHQAGSGLGGTEGGPGDEGGEGGGAAGGGGGGGDGGDEEGGGSFNCIARPRCPEAHVPQLAGQAAAAITQRCCSATSAHVVIGSPLRAEASKISESGASTHSSDVLSFAKVGSACCFGG